MSDVDVAGRADGGAVANSVLVALLLVDAAFIAVHIVLLLQGSLGLSPQFNVEVDGSFPELFNHLKWIACVAGCLWLFVRAPEPLYFGWTFVFVYLLLDDRFSLHETYGLEIANEFGWQPALLLRPLDFGELAVCGIAGTILFGGLAVAYLRSNNEQAKAFSRAVMLAFGFLVFFGVGIDMLHITLANPTVYAAVGTIEDGGEMVAASILTYLVLKQVLNLSPLIKSASYSRGGSRRGGLP